MATTSAPAPCAPPMMRPLLIAVTFSLWLLTVVLGIAEVVVLVDVLLAGYSAVLGWLGVVTEDYGREYWTGFNIQTIGALALGAGVLAMAVASGELYVKHCGTAKAWRWLGVILGVELLILGLGYFVSPDAFYLIGWLSGT